MADRSGDWLAQAQRDLAHAADASEHEHFEWACFGAQQGAEKAVKALYLHLHGEGWGHSVLKLLQGLADKASLPRPCSTPPELWTDITSPRDPRTDSTWVFPVNTTQEKKLRKRLSMRDGSSNSVKVFFADKAKVMGELCAWAAELKRTRLDVDKVGLFGSYATDTYGPRGDADPPIVLGNQKPRTGTKGMKTATS